MPSNGMSERHGARPLWRERGINEWKITKTDPGRIMLLDEAGQLFRPNVPKATKDRIISPSTRELSSSASAAMSSWRVLSNRT